MSRTQKISVAILAALLIVFAAGYRLAMPGTLFLLRFMEKGDSKGTLFTVQNVSIEKPGRALPARIYKPLGKYDKVYLVVHGVHSRGYDEPRLVHFAKVLAGLGHVVVTPEIDDLKNYEIRQRAVDDIALSAEWALSKSGLVGPNDKIGMLGISFSGGLCLSAAGRTGLQNRIRSVFSFGGHADLDRTMAYLVTGKLPEGGTLPPHVYGQAVIVRRFAHQLVPLEESEKLRAVLLDYLREDFAKVKASLDKLGPQSRQLVELCLKRNNKALGRMLEPVVRAHLSHDSLSPIRGRPPSCPVFLLHGSVDNVIPPSETTALARWARAGTKTTILITDLIKHVDLKNDKTDGSMMSYYRLIRFWTELLRS